MKQEQADSLKPAIISSSAIDSFAGLSATVFDTLISPTLDKLAHVAESFPIAGALVSTVKFGFALHNQLLVRKLTRFLVELKNISPDECQDFLHRLDTDAEYRQKVGENLILLLDRLDSIEKVDLCSRLFGLLMSNKVEYNEYRRFSALIDRAHLPDLLSLQKFTGGHSITEPVFDKVEIQGLNLVGVTIGPVGLINDKAQSEPNAPSHYLSAGLTELGKGFIEVLKQIL